MYHQKVKDENSKIRIHWGEGSLYSCILYFCNWDILHRPLCEDSDNIPLYLYSPSL
jgi:hypothetical protein